MAVHKSDPRESQTSDANAGLDITQQTNELGTWTNPGLYAPRQAVGSFRILMVATEAPPVHSGIARIVGYLRDGFQERGHQVDVLAYPQVGRLVFGEVRLSSLIFKLPQLFNRINEYDVIHVHGTTPTMSDVALLFARLRGRHPLVIYTHHVDLDFGSVSFLNKAYNYLHHRLSARADAVIAGTRDNLGLLGESWRSLVIPFGVDLEHFSTNGQKDARFTVLFIGQFRPWKGVRVLLQAMSHVSDARLLLAGQGPEEQAYRSQAKELGLDVEFHIGVDDNRLLQLYQRAHAVVVPSLSRLEAFGLALVEGMAAGCVPIASDLPGVREVVGQTGFLFSAGDTNHLATILCRLRDDSILVQQISDRARIRATEFSQERTICGYDRLITGLIVCRDLKKRLKDQIQSRTSVLHAFVTDVTRALEADWTELVLRGAQDELYASVSTEPTKVLGHPQLQRATSLLTRHAVDTGESTLVEPTNGPLHLKDEVVWNMPAMMVTPVTIDGENFGALLSMRVQPFNQQDLCSLTYFARHAAPSLHTLVKAARAKEKYI